MVVGYQITIGDAMCHVHILRCHPSREFPRKRMEKRSQDEQKQLQNQITRICTIANYRFYRPNPVCYHYLLWLSISYKTFPPFITILPTFIPLLYLLTILANVFHCDLLTVRLPSSQVFDRVPSEKAYLPSGLQRLILALNMDHPTGERQAWANPSAKPRWNELQVIVFEVDFPAREPLGHECGADVSVQTSASLPIAHTIIVTGVFLGIIKPPLISTSFKERYWWMQTQCLLHHRLKIWQMGPRVGPFPSHLGCGVALPLPIHRGRTCVTPRQK
ncbi:hypothetical protein ACLOJK_000277 [Asimina triloba]